MDKFIFIKRFRKKCPHCGNFPIFSTYIKTFKKCKKCGINYYLIINLMMDLLIVTIFVVGHILIPMILLVEKHLSPPLLFQMIIWPVLTIILCLWFLPKIKGAFLAFQIFLTTNQDRLDRKY